MHSVDIGPYHTVIFYSLGETVGYIGGNSIALSFQSIDCSDTDRLLQLNMHCVELTTDKKTL